jgi:hypothetical protein
VNKRLPIGLIVVVLASALAAAPALASQTSTQTFGFASRLKGTAGGGGAAPYGYLPLHKDEFAAAKAAANERANVGGGRPNGGGGGGAPIITTPSNVSLSFNGASQSGVTPPDTTGAIGNDRYIEGINQKYAIYSRTGSLIRSGSLSALTGISGGIFGYSISDPQMMWDAKTQRFYYAAVYYDSLSLSDNGIAIGFSETATPASSNDFCKYTMPYGDLLPDYPKLGDSSDFLLVGYNQYSAGASTYDGSAVWWLSKPPSGSTCPAPSVFKYGATGLLHNADAGHTLSATPVPANLVDDSNGTGYVVANADLTVPPYNTASGANFLTVFAVTKDGSGNATFSAPTNVGVASYSMPANAPEKGSSALIDTLDGRFEASVAAVDPTRNGGSGGIGVWTAHAVFGGAGTQERWYEIDPTGAGAIFQNGTATDDSRFVWNGAISPDRGNGSLGSSMAMSVSTSSATAYPAIAAVWKKGGGAQSALTTLVQATGPNVDFSCSPCRWGDYSGATPDPLGNGKVWLANQYNVASSDTSGTDWRTRIFALTPT